jgi:hypothetical protein
MVPTTGLITHAILTPEGGFSTENCPVLPGDTVVVAGLTLGAGGGGGGGGGGA